MPTTFHDREQGFEAKFAHDEEFRFLVAARRDKLFAHWAAKTLELSEEREEELVKAVLAIPNGPKHDAALLDYTEGVFAQRDGGTFDGYLAKALDDCGKEARRQLMETPPDHSDVL